jgi:hypothetical protein
VKPVVSSERLRRTGHLTDGCRCRFRKSSGALEGAAFTATRPCGRRRGGEKGWRSRSLSVMCSMSRPTC